MESEIGSTEEVSTAVVRAVSAVKGERFESLPTLADCIDPDALNTIFAASEKKDIRKGGEISFIYSGCRITVYNDEYLTVEPIEAVQYEETRQGPPVEPENADSNLNSSQE